MTDNDAVRPEQEQQKPSRYVGFSRVIVALKPGYVLRKVGQAYMVMPTGPRMKDYQGMITLNETGAFLFKEVEKPDSTPEKLEEACKLEYGATDEEAHMAVDSFITQCAQCGLFEVETKYIDTVENREVTEEELQAALEAEAAAAAKEENGE